MELARRTLMSTSRNTILTAVCQYTKLGLQAKNILTMKANEMHYFPNLFDEVLYMFRTGPLSIIRSISTLYTRNSYLSY